MSRTQPSILLLTVALGLAAAAVALAQGGPSSGSPMYDPKTEVTLKGTVSEVQPLQPGMHVTLKTAEGALDVHLGPSWFLRDEALSLAVGDEIQVLGSRVEVGGKDALIAREVTKGDAHVVLRDARGIPAWSGGKRR